MNSSNALNLQPILSRLFESALADENYTGVFEGLCIGLVEAGVPLLRAHLAMRTLHPLVASVDLTWYQGEALDVNPREYVASPREEWLSSPLYWMLENRKTSMRQSLRDTDATKRFPVFEEFKQLGATDYFATVTPFGDPSTAISRGDGIMTSWLSDAPEGFSAREIEALEFIQPYLGVVAKLSNREYTTRNILSAYLGDAVGQRVLDGQIRLGDVERIPAVIWYSDLRDSTAMAERMQVEIFLDAVNAYFECTGAPVLEHEGEVLRFIGDAVLAVFPISDKVSAQQAATRALAASREALKRMAALNESRSAQGQERLAFGLGLHVGELLFGNIGLPTRLEFSVIGRAANEVARLEDLTKVVREPVLVSQAFRDVLDLKWRDLGTHSAKGVGQGMTVFGLPLEE